MKAVILLGLLSLVALSPITKEYLADLKSKASFEVYNYDELPFKDTMEIEPFLGLNVAHLKDTSNTPLGNSNFEFPETFDSRVQWPNCIHPIRNQLKCGSCWAHAASEVLSDRFCIASNETVNVVLSPQDLVSCDFLDFGCNGGSLLFSWIYLRFFGIVTDECKPYTSGAGEVEKCTYFGAKCANETVEYKKYKAGSFYFLSSISSIKEDIINNGPVETGFYVYDDFMAYKSGVYRKSKGAVLKGGHAVKIVGWGKEESGDEYWIVANSWGPEWGEEGFFRIGFGECGIENIMAGTARLQ